nr:hypothetical protein [Leisingera sp. F5]
MIQQNPWRKALPRQQLPLQPKGGLPLAAGLNQHIQHELLLINGPPRPMLAASDRDDNFVQMLFAAEPDN